MHFSFKFSILIVSTFVLFLSACSTAKVRVLPGEDGINRIVSRDIEREGAEEAALDKAKEFCNEQKKQMYVVKEEKTNYQGSMDENTRKTVRNASKVAMVLGGPTGVATNSMGIGGAVAGAGMAGYGMTSNRDYEAQLIFRCK